MGRIDALLDRLSFVVSHCDLYSRVEKARRTEPCVKCGEPMLLGRSARGWWFRCVAPGCDGKRDLGRDPGRAVDLLTVGPAPETGT